MNWGVCLGGTPQPAELQVLGLGWVRVVALPGIGYHVARYQAAGVRVAGVIARESGDPSQYQGIPWDLLVIGNEMDGHPNSSSWPLTPEDFHNLWYYCSALFPTIPRIIGGLVSGVVDQGLPYLTVHDASGFSVHPYDKPTEPARALLRAYKAETNLPLWVTEWHRDAWEIPGFVAMLREETVGAFWFCWDESVPGFGLIDSAGVPKDKYWSLQEALDMPEFVWGFKDLAEKLGTDVVGEPLEDEKYINDIHGERVAHIQATTRGLMWYTPVGNVAHFFEARLPN